jgi:hypothetical protein
MRRKVQISFVQYHRKLSGRADCASEADFLLRGEKYLLCWVP